MENLSWKEILSITSIGINIIIFLTLKFNDFKHLSADVNGIKQSFDKFKDYCLNKFEEHTKKISHLEGKIDK